MTNRLLGRHVSVAFAPEPGLSAVFPRLEVVGNPVRREILALRDDAAPVPNRQVPRVFVFGGSQGARAINRAFTEALSRLVEWGGTLEILHQAGNLDLEWVQAAYRDCPIPHRVVPFLDDMAEALSGSRLIVSRAGASAVAEIATARRASVLIPIPHTSGEHQLRNAQRMANGGAAVLIEQGDLTGGGLADAIIRLLEDPARLDAMEAATDALQPGDAADTIARRCLELMGGSAPME